MTAGRPKQGDAGTLYVFAHQFYWDFRRLAEGQNRLRPDQKIYKKVLNETLNEKIKLTVEQKSNIAQIVEEEIEDGRLQASKHKKRMRELKKTQLADIREWRLGDAKELAQERFKIPGEPEVIDALLQADTSKQIRHICNDSPNWPISTQSVLPFYLSKYASEFIEAKHDPKFPKSTERPSSRLKQLWFLSRALAGAIDGYKARTSINMVGSMRPEQTFEQSRSAKPVRKQMDSRSKSWLQKPLRS